MHKQTIITVAMFGLISQTTLGSETSSIETTQQTQSFAKASEDKSESTVEQPAQAETTTQEETSIVSPEIESTPTPPEEVPLLRQGSEGQAMIPYKETSSHEESPALLRSTSSEGQAESTETATPPTEETVTIPGEETEPTQPTIPTMPEPIKEEPIVIPEEPEKAEAPAGIDTVSLENPQGNWLYKRIWWERAEERYEKIRLLVDAIWESRTIFFVKRNELDRNVLDPFYLNVGIGQGELQVILSELVDFFEKHREQQGDLNEQERSLYDTIATEEEALKQLKQDVESVANLDHAIDDALGTLMNQINRVRQYERQAWENFKEIAHILNDTKARELYYMIEGAARNIKNISTYVEQDFFTHFAKLIEEATKHVNRVQSQIESLKEKGVSFKRQTELLEQKQEQLEQEEEEEVAPKPKLGWFGWIMSYLNSVSDFIFSIIRMPYDLIFGK